MTDLNDITDFEIENAYTPYYKLDNGKVYDKDKLKFVDNSDAEYKVFIDAGNEPLSINNGYTVQELKDSVLKFYGWPIGDCLLTLDELKQNKLLELETRSAKFEDNLNKNMYFKSSLGFKCNGDRRTRSNIEDLISTFALVSQGQTTVDYRDYDNHVQKVTLENLKTLLAEHIGNGLNIYQQKWALQDKINNAQSVDELNQIQIECEMKDYTV